MINVVGNRARPGKSPPWQPRLTRWAGWAACPERVQMQECTCKRIKTTKQERNRPNHWNDGIDPCQRGAAVVVWVTLRHNGCRYNATKLRHEITMINVINKRQAPENQQHSRWCSQAHVHHLQTRSQQRESGRRRCPPVPDQQWLEYMR